MEATDIISVFWTSVLGKGFEKELSVVMNFKDPEEKIIQLLSRMLFIVTLEIKSEKDDAIKRNKELGDLKLLKDAEDAGCIDIKKRNMVESRKVSDTDDRNCKRLMFEDDIQHESDEDIFPDTEIEKEENFKKPMPMIGRRKRNRKVESDDAENSNKKSCKELSSIKNSPEYSLSRDSKENKPVKSLSRSQRKNNSNDKNSRNRVLAPETQFLNENVFYFDVTKRQGLATQTVSVPETMQMTQCINVQSEKYDNVDFFDARCTMDSETQIDGIGEVINNQPNNKPTPLLQLKSDAMQSLESPSKQVITSPVEGSQKILSPVLGKPAKLITPNSHRSSSKKLTSPKKSSPVKKTSSPKEPLKQAQINTPWSPSQILSPSSKYNPLAFTRDINSSVIESDQESPSLLPWNNYKNIAKKNEIENDAALDTATQPTEFREPEKGFLNKRKMSLRKTQSSFDVSTPKTSGESAFRLNRSRKMQPSHGGFEMTVEPPPSPGSKKNYKQTKITAKTFAPKKTDLARITGGDRGAVRPEPLDEDMEKAIEESLKSAKAEEMMKMKRDELIKEGIASPKKVNNKSPSQESLRRSPRKLQKSPSQSYSSLKKVSKTSPVKKKIKVSGSAIQDDLRNGGNTLNVDQDVASQERMLGLTEIVEAVSQNCESEETRTGFKQEMIEPMSQDFKVPQIKPKIKKKLVKVDSSFDTYSMKVEEEPGYAYKNEVVRKKSDRKKLIGVDCKECEDYFKISNLTDTQIQAKLDRCSRHRVKYKATTNTPPGFWDADWPETQDD